MRVVVDLILCSLFLPVGLLAADETLSRRVTALENKLSQGFFWMMAESRSATLKRAVWPLLPENLQLKPRPFLFV